ADGAAPSSRSPTAAASSSVASDRKVDSLVAAFIEERQREMKASESPVSPRGARRVVVGLLALVCIAAWVAPYPSAVAPGADDPQLDQASARATIYLAARSVEHFRSSSGRLPRTLAEAGVERAGLSLSLEPNGTYTLRAPTGADELTYNSATPLHSFLGTSEDIIAQSGH
ncbi:MAG TPA: hypothetical protein VFV33_02950, partial [Gemmatimonadaceae bacterium]|nr:hypothetical protein [Gemmatimonadaceae bacterium]